MPYPIEMMIKLQEAMKLVQKGKRNEAANIVEDIYTWTERSWEAFNDIEAMNLLGSLALILGETDQTDREIRIFEKLCILALKDLERLGLMATDDDIHWTGMDFIRLGLAYNKAGRLSDARSAFEKGKEVLEELGWLVEVEKLLKGEETTIGPSPLVEKRPYQIKPGEIEELMRQFEASNARLRHMPEKTGNTV